jgi:hypothetical protein
MWIRILLFCLNVDPDPDFEVTIDWMFLMKKILKVADF